MRSENLRPAPAFLTPEMVRRMLEQIHRPHVVDAAGTAVVCMAQPKPELRLVEAENPPVEHARQAEEGEAEATPASPPRPPNIAPAWSREEDERLRQVYAEGGRVDLVAREMGRTAKAAHTRAKKLGLTHPREIKGGFIVNRSWSPEEDALLRELYGNVPTSELPGRIGRSKAAIFTRAHALGLDPGYRGWTRDEVQALRIAHERGIALPDLAATLGRHVDSVTKYACNHGYNFGHRRTLPSPLSIEQLLALADPAVEIANWQPGPRRGRYANKLSLHEQPEFRRLAEIAFRRGIAAVDLAHAAGEPIATVLQANKRLGLHFGKRPPLAQRISRAQLLEFDDDAIPLPELRRDKVKRERLERSVKIHRVPRHRAPAPRAWGLHKQPDFVELARIAFDRGVALADLAHALAAPKATVSQAAHSLGFDFGRRPRFDEPPSREDILRLRDPNVPLPTLRCDRLRRELLDRRAGNERQRRAAAREAGQPRTQAYAERTVNAEPNPDRARIDRANARRSAAIKRSIEQQAIALLDGDESVRSVGGQVNSVVAAAMVEIRYRRAAEHRQRDPVEQAKLALQRAGLRPVCSMAVHGGDPNLYQIGSRKNVTRDELLAMAARHAA